MERMTYHFSVSRYSISSIGVFSQTYLTNSWRITGDPTTPCSRLTCPPNAMCIVTVNGTAQCACSTPSCSKTSRTICGSNGKTYKNSCDMEIESCQRNETIFAQHDGRCKGRQGTAYCDAPLLYCLLISLITHALFNCQETHPRLNFFIKNEMSAVRWIRCTYLQFLLVSDPHCVAQAKLKCSLAMLFFSWFPS